MTFAAAGYGGIRSVGGYPLTRAAGRAPARSIFALLAISFLLLLLSSLLAPVAHQAGRVSTSSAPRSYETLTVDTGETEFPYVDFTFLVQNPVGPWASYTKAKYINISAELGPELMYDGGPSWNDTARDTWNVTFTMRATIAEATRQAMSNNPGAAVFTTVNISLTYTDASGNMPREIVQAVTFALYYEVPANLILLPAALGMGLGGAGVVGLGVYVVRRAKLDELFLMHDSGMLIRHWSRKGDVAHDTDIMSGMFIVLQEFVRDTWKSYDDGEANLEEVRFGDQRVVIARGAHSVLAAVVQGRYLNGIPKKLRRAVDDFERSSGPVLKDWNGNLALLPEADSIAERLLKERSPSA